MLLNDLLNEFSSKAVLTYARARITRQYVGVSLFPEANVNELTYEYWKSINRLPVMAEFQTYGAEASIASREGASKVVGEIPPIKRKIPMSERLLIALKREGAGDADIVKNTIYADLDNLIESVRARIEKARMDAIAFGKIELAENGLIMKVDFGVPAEHQTVLADSDVAEGFWNYANSDPIGMIQKWTMQVNDDTGVMPEYALTSMPIVSTLLKTKSVRQMIYGDLGGSRPVTLSQVNGLLNSMSLPTIASYDLKVRTQGEDGKYAQTRLFPANKFVLLPGSNLGNTLIGPTAEALLDSALSSQEAPGLYATVDVAKEPVGIWTKVAMSAFPTFPMADSVFQATVLKS